MTLPPTHILSNDGGASTGISVDGAAGALVNNGQPHLVAMTWQKNTINGFKSIFDGGIVVQRGSSNTGISNIATDVLLGRYTGTPQEFLVGVLDEVRIYSRAFSPTEVANYYANQNNCGAFVVTGAEQ